MDSNKIKSFSSLHPLVLLVYFLSVIGIAMFSFNPVILIAALVGGVLFFLTLKNGRNFLSDLLFYIPMFVLMAIINPLFSHNGVTPLFFMNGNPVTMEAILCGCDIALMIISVIYWCKCYSEIMTADKFLYLFGRVIPKLALVLSMAMRFIPLFVEKLKEFRSVQSTVGLYNKKGLVNRLTSELKVFSALISWSLENSVDTALSMKARGYGLKGRTHFCLFKFKPRDLFFIIVILSLFSVTLAGMALGIVDFQFYPEVTVLKFSYVEIFIYISFGILSFMPFITELWEVTKWKYSVSKI